MSSYFSSVSHLPIQAENSASQPRPDEAEGWHRVERKRGQKKQTSCPDIAKASLAEKRDGKVDSWLTKSHRTAFDWQETRWHGAKKHSVDASSSLRAPQVFGTTNKAAPSRVPPTSWLTSIQRSATASVEQKKWREAELCVRQAIEQYPHELALHHQLLTIFDHKGSVDQLQEHFNELRASGPKPDSKIFLLVVDVLIKKGLNRRAWALFEGMVCSDEAKDLALIRAIGRSFLQSHDGEMVWNFVSHLQDKGFRFSPDTCCLLLDACEKFEQPERAWSVFKTMQSSGLRGDASIYSRLIALCDAAGRHDCVWFIFRAMQAANVRGQSQAYLALIHSMGDCRQYKRATMIFDSMRSDGMGLDRAMSNCLVAMFGAPHPLSRTWVVFEAMQAAQIEGTQELFGVLLEVACRGKQMQKAWKVFDCIQAVHARMKTDRWSLLLQLLDGYEQPDKAWQVFSEMREQGVTADVDCYRALLHVLRVGGQSERIEEVLASQRADGLEEDHGGVAVQSSAKRLS